MQLSTRVQARTALQVYLGQHGPRGTSPSFIHLVLPPPQHVHPVDKRVRLGPAIGRNTASALVPMQVLSIRLIQHRVSLSMR
eukprot:351829-Chlamydomonas_euryale.AAC.6